MLILDDTSEGTLCGLLCVAHIDYVILFFPCPHAQSFDPASVGNLYVRLQYLPGNIQVVWHSLTPPSKISKIPILEGGVRQATPD